MGKTDILAREYFSDKRRFADAFNYLLYDGRAAIAPGDLSPLDSVGVVTSSEARGRAIMSVPQLCWEAGRSRRWGHRPRPTSFA